MQFKQGAEGYRKNIEIVMKKLLPAVLKNTEKNGQRVSDWLVENCSEGDIVDASVENILKAIKALDGAPLGVEWEIAPAKTPIKRQPDFLQTNDGARHNQPKNSELDIAMAAERKRREKLGEQEHGRLMSESAALVRNHTNFPHSRAIRERTILKELYDKLVSTKTHPKQVLEALQAKRSEFEGADITRPKFDKK